MKQSKDSVVITFKRAYCVNDRKPSVLLFKLKSAGVYFLNHDLTNYDLLFGISVVKQLLFPFILQFALLYCNVTGLELSDRLQNDL